MAKSVLDLKVTAEPKPGVGKTGTKYLQLKMVEDTQDGAKWYDGVVFGPFSELVAKKVGKGDEVRIEGTITVKEYTKRDGGVGTNNSLIVDKVTLVGGETIDKFASEAKKEAPPF